MSKARITIPDDIKGFLEVEHCDDFPIERYYVTQQQNDILHDIIRMRKITNELQKMNIPYLNTTLLYGPSGSGKAQPMDSKVLTPTGYARMGDMKIDSSVATPGGEIASVMGVYPQGMKPIYRLRLDDGRECECSDEHLWKVCLPSGSCHVITLRGMMEGAPAEEGKPLELSDYRIPVRDAGGKIHERRVESITYKGTEECQCIYVAHPDHLYVTDDGVITHNTSLCKYIAHKLDLDFAYINYAKMMSGGVMGDTANNIDKVFRFMAKTECLFLMDEVDYIATKRGTEAAATGGELSRLTITLMQELDYYKKIKVKSVIMAATNRKDQVDPALLSRFAITKEIGALSIPEKVKYIQMYLDNVGVPYDLRNIQGYCAKSVMANQRNIENDMIRCIARWVDKDRKEPFELSKISNE